MQGSRTVTKLGVALGVAIMGGSLLGGLALAAANLGDPPSAPVPAASLNDRAEGASPAPPPSVASPGTTGVTGGLSGGAAGATNAAGTRTSQPGTPPPPMPDPTPTCWDKSLGEHPEGIENCEDK